MTTTATRLDECHGEKYESKSRQLLFSVISAFIYFTYMGCLLENHGKYIKRTNKVLLISWSIEVVSNFALNIVTNQFGYNNVTYSLSIVVYVVSVINYFLFVMAILRLQRI